jgi:hypothetical protein
LKTPPKKLGLAGFTLDSTDFLTTTIGVEDFAVIVGGITAAFAVIVGGITAAFAVIGAD